MGRARTSDAGVEGCVAEEFQSTTDGLYCDSYMYRYTRYTYVQRILVSCSVPSMSNHIFSLTGRRMYLS